jgi:hypothetical protein
MVDGRDGSGNRSSFGKDFVGRSKTSYFKIDLNFEFQNPHGELAPFFALTRRQKRDYG